MYQLIGESDFAQSMRTYAGWPYSASCAFFWFVEDTYTSNDGFGMELDPIGLRCGFSVYSDFDAYIECNPHGSVATLGELEELTLVIEADDGCLVVQDF